MGDPKMNAEMRFRVVESRALPHPGQILDIKEFLDVEGARALLGELVHAGTGRQFAILDGNGNMLVDESGKPSGRM